MTTITSRADFEQLMDLRMREAKLLLDHQNWDGSYYLAGYAVEFALKVCIISRLMQTNSCPDKAFVGTFYQHNLTSLCKLAELDVEMTKDPAVNVQWSIVQEWSEQNRYEIGKSEQVATDMYEAIERGVLPWVKSRW